MQNLGRGRTVRRAFTLLELIVTLLVLALLAGVAIVGYTTYTDRAQAARVRADLVQYATGALANAVASNADQLARTDVTAALAQSDRASVVDTISAAAPATSVRLLGAGTAPSDPQDLAVTFDAGDGTPASDQGGTRMWLAAAIPGGRVLTQLVVWGQGLACAASQPAGTPLSVARTCTSHTTPIASAADDTATTRSGWPVTVDVRANDTNVTGTPVLGAPPLHGTATVRADGTFTYLSDDSFVGTDTFTYTVDGASAKVTVTVTPLVSCSTTTLVDSGWVPSGTGTSGSCPADSVGEVPPLAGLGLVGTVSGDMTVKAITSYPHSDLNYPHVMYALAGNGGLAWVQDTGNQGTTNPSGQAGCAGLSPTCAWGWLYAPGTYTSPSAAITGQGPNHGTIPARFTYDSMFVADANGLWVSRVNAFVRGTAPTKLLAASAYTGTITSLTGFTCYSGSTATAGNCVWFLTTAGVLGQLNVDTGALWTTTISVPSSGAMGSFGTPKFLAAITESGTAKLLVQSTSGHLARFTPAGALLATSWQSQSATVSAATMAGGQLVDTTTEPNLWAGTAPSGGVWNLSSFLKDQPVAGTPSAVASHGVPGQLYYATSGAGQCLIRVSASDASTHPLWCPGSGSLAAAPGWPADTGVVVANPDPFFGPGAVTGTYGSWSPVTTTFRQFGGTDTGLVAVLHCVDGSTVNATATTVNGSSGVQATCPVQSFGASYMDFTISGTEGVSNGNVWYVSGDDRTFRALGYPAGHPSRVDVAPITPALPPAPTAGGWQVTNANPYRSGADLTGTYGSTAQVSAAVAALTGADTQTGASADLYCVDGSKVSMSSTGSTSPNPYWGTTTFSGTCSAAAGGASYVSITQTGIYPSGPSTEDSDRTWTGIGRFLGNPARTN